MSSRARANRGVAFTLREYWVRAAARWSRNRDAEAMPRGVSRKARQQMVRIRIAKRPASGRVAKRSKLNFSGKQQQQQEIAPWGSSIIASNSGTSNKTRLKRNSSGLTAHVSPKGSKEGYEDSDAAVAVKVKRGLLGVCQRRASSDVVLVPSRETCVICMENFRPGEVLEVLLCQHIYHVRCIDRWLGANTWCCVCKADVEEMARAVRQRPRPRFSRSRSDNIGTRWDDSSESTRSGPPYISQRARSAPSAAAPSARPGPIDATSRGGRRGQTVYGSQASRASQALRHGYGYGPYGPRLTNSTPRGSRAPSALRSTLALGSINNNTPRSIDIYPNSPNGMGLGSSGVNFGTSPPGMGARTRSPSARDLTPPLIVSHMSVCTPERNVHCRGESKEEGKEEVCSSSSSNSSIGISSSSRSSSSRSNSSSSRSSSMVGICAGDYGQDGNDAGRALEIGSAENNQQRQASSARTNTSYYENAAIHRRFTRSERQAGSPRPSRLGPQNPGLSRSKSLGRVLSLQRIFSGTPSAPARVLPHESQPGTPLARRPSSATLNGRARASRSQATSLAIGTSAAPHCVGANPPWSRSLSTPAVIVSTPPRNGARPRIASRADSPGPNPSAVQHARAGTKASRQLSPTLNTLSTPQRMVRIPRSDHRSPTSPNHGRSTAAVRGSRRHWGSPERGLSSHVPSPPGDSPGARPWGAGSSEVLGGRQGQRYREQCGGTGVILSARARMCVESTLPTAAQLSLRSLPGGKVNNCPSPEEEDSWLDGFDKSPSSEAASESGSYSTQWSETVSQASGCSDSAKTLRVEGSVASEVPSRAQACYNRATSPEPQRVTRGRSRGRASRSEAEGPRSRSRSARLIWDDGV